VNRREYKPAYTPEVKDVFDTSNFDPEYTELPVADSLIADSAISEAANANFDGFTYVAKSKLNDGGK